MCHIDATDMAPPLTSKSLREQRLQCAVAAVGDPGRQRRLAGQATMPSRASAAPVRAVVEERVVGQRPQRRIDDADPVDRALGVDVHPQVLQAGVPGPALEHDQRHDPADDDVGQGGRQLLGDRRRGCRSPRRRSRTSPAGDRS